MSLTLEREEPPAPNWPNVRRPTALSDDRDHGVAEQRSDELALATSDEVPKWLGGGSLRRTVNSVALFVAIVISLAGPVAFGLSGYHAEENRASFRAQLGANRLSHAIAQKPMAWRDHTMRLGDIIKLKEAAYRIGRSRILDDAGNVVFEENDQNHAWTFDVTRSYPIIFADETLGSVEFDAPLDGLLLDVGAIALLSILLGLCTYLTVRTFPLRVLDRTLQDLEGAHRIISTTNSKLKLQNQALREREFTLEATQAVLDRRSTQLVEAQQLGKLGDWSFRFGDSMVVWAPEIYELLGYNRDSFSCSHANVMAIYVGDGAARVLESQAAVMRTRQPKSVDVKGRRGDGSIVDFALTSKPMTDETGRTVGLFGTIQDISERKAAEEQLKKLAYYDPLTGLANRSLFHREVCDVIVRCGRTGRAAALLLLDLDRFKEVNDSLGHGAGDELLVRVAHLLSRAVGSEHFVARLGGDEFAVILGDHAAIEPVERLASEILRMICGPMQLDRGEVTIGTSIGIAMIPRDGPNLNDLMRAADLALYRAKEDGRGRFQFFEEGMSAAVQHKMALGRDLRQAIATNTGLSVHYQPQVDLSTDRVIGFEALMRWTHPTLGNVPPSEFIPIAESSQLICDIGLWILREASLQAKAWIDAGEPPREVSVNVSAAQIWHTDFVSDVVRILAETGLPPHLLCLELTESLLADHAEGRVRAVLHELKQLGVTLALDDFGTHYSSLGYLTQLPFDKLKIDRIFVDGIATSKRARKLLEGVIALGRGLGMTIVMEGVEQHEEVEILRGFNCDIIQGYVFARPTVAAQALAFAKSVGAEPAQTIRLMPPQAAVA
jgi:diguanylate cyclase (GGDEF)-like protein/PAS domain S-box-containing protein